MTEMAILAVILVVLLVLLRAMQEGGPRGLPMIQAIGLAKLLIFYRLRIDESVDPAVKTPEIRLYSRQSLLDAMVLWCLLPADTLHFLHPVDRRSLWTFWFRRFARTARAGDMNALGEALGRGGSVTLAMPPDIEPDKETLARYTALAGMAKAHGASIIAMHVGGSVWSTFSARPKDMAPRHLFPRLSVAQSPAFDPANPEPAGNGATAPRDCDRIHDLMALAKFRSNDFSRSLFLAFRDAADLFSRAGPVLEDALGGKLTYRKMLIGARALGVRIAAISRPGEAVGVLLPNANGVVVTFLALQSAGRVAAMLNYTAGPAAILSALSTAQVRTILASRAFVEKAGLEAVVEAIESGPARIVWLEDLRASLTFTEKLLAALLWRKPLQRVIADDPAVVLFTSGSEGTPKGVVLTHKNLRANAAQAEARVGISVRDKLFNVLPVFHCFGLTGGTILPLLYGVRLFLYPSPLHYRIIPAVAREVEPTIMFGTDTFLAGYARTARDTDFASLRMIVAGAEAVRAQTRATYLERFGAIILEGYGMTEASPVAAVNSDSHNKEGSVGRLLPAMALRLEHVEGIHEGGRMYVSGPNIMAGYMLADKPGVLQPLVGGWHDSGDIVVIDENGFITISGRAKRFAKIAGEMVSLGAIEIMVQGLWPEAFHAAVSVPDSRKGERIVLVTTRMPALREELRDYSKRFGGTDLMIPGEIVNVEQIPILGSGKTDYSAAQKIAENWLDKKKNGKQ